MNKKGITYIRKWLLIYLAMVMLTTMVLYLAIYLEMTGMMTLSEIGRGEEGRSASGLGQTDQQLFGGLKLRLLMILTGGLIAIALLGYFWMVLISRRLGQPMRTISVAIGRLAKGQLNETVVIDTSDEFEHIGASINELSANLQELLLHIWKQTGQCLVLIENIRNNPDMRNERQLTLEGLGYLKQLSESIEDLREMAKGYVFYDVSIEGAKTTAVKDLGDLSSHLGAAKTTPKFESLAVIEKFPK